MEDTEAAHPEPTPLNDDEHACTLPHFHSALSLMRRRVRKILAEWEMAPPVAEDVLLVISELATNAIVHTDGPAGLRLSWTEVDGRSAVRVEVTDSGPSEGLRAAAGATDPDEHGRGLGIVRALSARHGVRSDYPGFTHWADLFAAWRPSRRGSVRSADPRGAGEERSGRLAPRLAPGESGSALRTE
ncbi:ATP-binding protein [Streptomyces sp. PA03-1a]|nr:ATP-binding protein [Streptomyces sp. PA03-1a]MDX2814643.1 ATP-binding protein [Streptomyces sp. PA03-5A]